jgi:hypothetical protein
MISIIILTTVCVKRFFLPGEEAPLHVSLCKDYPHLYVQTLRTYTCRHSALIRADTPHLYMQTVRTYKCGLSLQNQEKYLTETDMLIPIIENIKLTFFTAIFRKIRNFQLCGEPAFRNF